MTDALCQQPRIAGGRCTNRALYRVRRQPGSPSAMPLESVTCATCIHKMRNTAAALGFQLDVRRLEDEHDTMPAPPQVPVFEDEPDWMSDTQPGVTVGDIGDDGVDPLTPSLRDFLHRPAEVAQRQQEALKATLYCRDCGGHDGAHSMLCRSGKGQP